MLVIMEEFDMLSRIIYGTVTIRSEIKLAIKFDEDILQRRRKMFNIMEAESTCQALYIIFMQKTMTVYFFARTIFMGTSAPTAPMVPPPLSCIIILQEENRHITYTV